MTIFNRNRYFYSQLLIVVLLVGSITGLAMWRIASGNSKDSTSKNADTQQNSELAVPESSKSVENSTQNDQTNITSPDSNIKPVPTEPASSGVEDESETESDEEFESETSENQR